MEKTEIITKAFAWFEKRVSSNTGTMWISVGKHFSSKKIVQKNQSGHFCQR